MQQPKHKYKILIKHNNESISYLIRNSRTEWGIKTAYKHLNDCVREQQANSPEWANVRFFACVMA